MKTNNARAEAIARILAHTDAYKASELRAMSDSVLRSVYEIVFANWLPHPDGAE